MGTVEEVLETGSGIAPSSGVADFDEEGCACDLAGRPGEEKAGVGDPLAEQMGDGLVVGRLARLRMPSNLVDVVAEDEVSDAGVPGAERLHVVEVATVVAGMADVEECADRPRGIGYGVADRVDPTEVFADPGGEPQLG